MKFCEVETKYNADKILLKEFTTFCKARGPLKSITASGFDHFYEKLDDSGSFCRHRIGEDFNQLTFKRKTTDNNNFVRTEHNITLSKDTTRDQIEALCGEFGYKYNTSVFKNAFIYCYDWYSFVFYIVYDMYMNELGRFIEIEMSEEHNWISEDEAWHQLLILEKLCKEIGISPQARIKRSLFELYRKERANAPDRT